MQSRLARIFNPQSNRTVMLAFDHGYFQGPTTGLERIDLSIAPLFEETDVLMCTRGVLRSQVPAATNKPVVLRASGGNSILSELSNECVAVAMEDACASTSARWRRRSISAANTNTSRSITSLSWWMRATATVCRCWR
jgi:DhnA family fructose-bisphosphate aldolase class Ia